MSKKKDAQEARKEFEKQLQKKYDCSWVEALRRMAIEKDIWTKTPYFIEELNSHIDKCSKKAQNTPIRWKH